jgi:hypothetical protein
VRVNEWVVALVLLAAATPAQAQDKVIGLLALPEVFGSGQCSAFQPEDVPLHPAPNDGRTVGIIRVDQNWSFAPHGGCEGLEVSVHAGDARHDLPTEEFDYERPAAIVLEQSGGWFKIRLKDGTAWVAASVVDRFMPLRDLFEEFVGVTAINTGYTGRLVVAPGRQPDASSARVIATQPVRVIEIRNVFGQAWVEVEVFDHSICNAAIDGPPETVARGWLPMHTPKGEPTIWFSSRGC